MCIVYLGAELCHSVACFAGMTMGSRLKIFTIAAALAAGSSGAAMAQYGPSGPQGVGNSSIPQVAPPAAGALGGDVSRAAGGPWSIGSGAYAPFGHGGAGTAKAGASAAPTPDCGAGRVYYNGACYPDLTGAWRSQGLKG